MSINTNQHISHRGRGTTSTPPNRFERFSTEEDPAAWEEMAQAQEDFEPIKPRTTWIPDDSKSIITQNNSPDIGFSHSLNPYRGCEHGCAYCYARPYHEYLGYNAGLDFESKIVVKKRAPELLEEALSKPGWTPVSLACSGVTDCYQPLEKTLEITRGCLEVLTHFRNPVGIITKNALVTRDIDHLRALANHDAALVVISITTLDSTLSSVLEPRASTPNARLNAMRTLSESGIPTGVSLAPIIPGLNDHEIPAIFEAAAAHGASFASGTVLRLPHCVKDVFSDWLDQFQPGRKELILNRVRELRDGKLNESDFSTRMTGKGPLANDLQQLLTISKQRAGLESGRRKLSTSAFRKRIPGQRELFEEW